MKTMTLATRAFFKGCPIKKCTVAWPKGLKSLSVRTQPVNMSGFYKNGTPWVYLDAPKGPRATPTQFCSLAQYEMLPILRGLSEKDFKKLVTWVLTNYDAGGYGESKKETTFRRLALHVAGERGIDLKGVTE